MARACHRYAEGHCGFTRARIDVRVAPVMPTLDAKGAARAAADQQALVQRSIDRLEGRLRDQLLRLRRLVAQQNTDGVAVTKVRVTRTRASQRRAKADTQPQPTHDRTP